MADIILKKGWPKLSIGMLKTKSGLKTSKGKLLNLTLILSFNSER